MKGKSVGKLLILSSLSIVALFACNKDNNTVAETTPSQSKMLPIYVYNKNNPAVPKYIGLMDFKFYNIEGLPYVNVIDYINAFTGYSSNVYSVTHKNDVFTFTNNIWKYRSSSYKPNAYFDMKNQTLKYDDYACFVNINSAAYHPMDLVAGRDVEVDSPTLGEKVHLFSNPQGSYIAGTSTQINVKSAYNIDSYVYNNNLYMPLYTAKALFTSNYIPSFIYNGNAIYQHAPNTDKYEDYVDNIKNPSFFKNVSSSYLEYNYNQMIMELDLRYGMGGLTRNNRSSVGSYKYSKSFSGLISGYKSRLIDVDQYDDGIEDLYSETQLDDGGHTGIYCYSYNHTYTAEKTYDFKRGTETKYISESYNNILGSRHNQSIKKNEILGYIENNTFVIRSNEFDEGLRSNLYKLTQVQIDQTYKDYSNYIIDLSCNGGGYIYMQHLLNQFLSRGNSYNYFYCSVNGSKGSIKYDVNTNLNKTFNEDSDFIKLDSTIEIYCSNATFSAANATAFYAKNKNNVTIKGEQTGGGTCAIDSTVMSALGAGMQISSPYRITNSSFIDNDDGVKPDSTITANNWNSHDTTGKTKYSEYEPNLEIIQIK